MAISVIDMIRRNHALEHAVISVLMDRGVQGPLVGNANPYGFFLYGSLEKEEVESAVSEALNRLLQGESELAVSPYCGTNLVVGALIAGLISGIMMRKSRGRLRSMSSFLIGIMAASWLRNPLGGMIQRRYTTLARVEGLRIKKIGRFRIGRLIVCWVGTDIKSS